MKAKSDELKAEIKRSEDRLYAIEHSTDNREFVATMLNDTIDSIEAMLNTGNWTNDQLRKVIEKITVNTDGEIVVYIKLLRGLGLEAPVEVEGIDSLIDNVRPTGSEGTLTGVSNESMYPLRDVVGMETPINMEHNGSSHVAGLRPATCREIPLPTLP